MEQMNNKKKEALKKGVGGGIEPDLYNHSE